MAAEPLLRRAALWRIALALALLAPVIAAIGSWTDIDVNLANWMFDPVRREFPWRHRWIADNFSHAFMRLLLTAVAIVIIAVAAWDAVKPLKRWTAGTRLRARILALSCIAVPTVTSLLKRASVSHCPWDLSAYGGDQPYVRLFDALPPGALAGHCLPAGHASSALWLVALGVFWLPGRPRLALLMSGLGLLAGWAMGWMQQLRGAHFLTHTLWSMWIACALVTLIVALAQWLSARR